MQCPGLTPQCTGYSGYTGTPVCTSTQLNQAPPWATSIIEDIKSIKISVSTIDKIELTVNQIKKSLDDLPFRII